MKKLLSLACALVVAGCGDVVPSAPAGRHVAPKAPRFDLTCRSGYAVAYNTDGTAYCAPADSTYTTSAAAATTTATP